MSQKHVENVFLKNKNFENGKLGKGGGTHLWIIKYLPKKYNTGISKAETKYNHVSPKP